jgi:hypothetical protein
MLKGVRQQLQTYRHAFGRNINPVDRPIKRGVRVDVPAFILNRLGKGARAALFRAFEKHVLEQMREARTEPAVLMNAAGLHPRLETRHRRAEIFVNDQRQSVRQGQNFSVVRRQCNHCQKALSRRFPTSLVPTGGGPVTRPQFFSSTPPRGSR